MTKYTEKDIQRGVISALKAHGWFVQRNQQGLGSTPGRPDLEAYKQSCTLFVECKSPRGKVSPHQQTYFETLTRQGMKVLIAADVEVFCQELEKIEEQLWGDRRIRRLL